MTFNNTLTTIAINMKLIRVGPSGKETPAMLTADGRRLQIPSEFGDYNETFFENDGLQKLKDWQQDGYPGALELDRDERLGMPVSRPSKLVCIGLNYADHAKETGGEPPEEPVLFFKSTTACCGPYDDLILPKDATMTDWEVELALVIGKRASNVEEAEAMDYLAGYTIMCDYSERHWQFHLGGQWNKGKSADTFAPVGPYLITPDEIADPHNLKLWLDVNGVRKQDSSTSNLIFGIPFLIAYISRFMTLLPGDIISTGTPAGVGFGMRPREYIQPGDTIRLGIESLGEQYQIAKRVKA